MPITYTSRKGFTYTLCQGTTKTGKPRYYFARESKDQTLDQIPAGYAISESVNVPVVASGGAGKLEHMSEVLAQGKADAVLAASIFHFAEYTIQQAKEHLRMRGIEVRL